jgi:hypothetical protein
MSVQFSINLCVYQLKVWERAYLRQHPVVEGVALMRKDVGNVL